MRIFVGYGYNDRDAWIERDVIPLLEAFEMEVSNGKDMHGEILQQGVRRRIDQADAVVSFFTLRQGQENAEYNSHGWVHSEAAYAIGRDKPILLVFEQGVKYPKGILGDRRYISFSGDKLACVSELIQALRQHRRQRLRLQPVDQDITRQIRKARREMNLEVLYRTRIAGVDSELRPCRTDFQAGICVEVDGLPSDALVEVRGKAAGQTIFLSEWAPVDAVQIEVA